MRDLAVCTLNYICIIQEIYIICIRRELVVCTLNYIRPISKTGGSERSDFNHIGEIQDKEPTLIQNAGKGLLKSEHKMLQDGYKLYNNGVLAMTMPI
jgi:hypothetical protein